MARLQALNATSHVRSHQEPVVYIHEVWRTRNIGGDDKNPKKWWNQGER